MEDLSLRGLTGKDNPSDSRVKEWTYAEAVEKLMKLFPLPELHAKAEISFAVGGDIHDPIPQDRFEYAMRRTQRDPVYNISPIQLEIALMRFYLEIQEIIIPPAQLTQLQSELKKSPQTLLNSLMDAETISEKQFGVALFYFIVEKCDEDMQNLIIEYTFDPRGAVRGSRSRNQITPEQARVAEFCLLTGLGPSAARGDQEKNEALKKDARVDLHGAVEHALAPSIELRPLDYAVKCTQARLFPLKCNIGEIREKLRPLVYGSNDDPKHIKAREHYLIEFFQQRTQGVSDQDAKAYLAASDWNMMPAVNEWQAKVTQLPPLSHAGSRDTSEPPDIQQGSIIVGLLGVVDRGPPLYRASPGSDGWFVSDCYFWKHLLRGFGYRQKWVTCLDPESLVEKYTQGNASDIFKRSPGDTATTPHPDSWDTGYVHGQATAQRVAVLDKDNLDFARKDLLVFEETSLLREYLQLVEKAFEEAEKDGRPLVLLMFSHGDIETFNNLGGFLIGFYDLHSARKEHFLTADNIADIHARYPTVKLTLFLTSCFSGHWVTSPYFTSHDVTVVASTRPNEPSFSFPESNSMRHAGGLYSAAFKEELVREPTTSVEEHLSREYADMMDYIVAGVEGLIRTPDAVAKGVASLPMFSPDSYYEKFNRRTGYPLADYKANYDRLKKLPPSTYSQSADPQTEGLSLRSSAYGPTSHHISQSVQDLIWQYESTFPTILSSDHELKSLINRFKSDLLSDEAGLRVLQSQLAFRAGKCSFADLIVKLLKLYKGAATSVSDWDPHQNLGAGYRERLGEIVLILKHNTSWFKAERTEDGVGYEKPWLYVAHAMWLHKRSDVQVKALITEMKEILAKQTAAGSKRVRGDKSWNEVMLEHRAGQFQPPGSPSKKPRRKTIGEVEAAFVKDSGEKEN